MFTIVKKQTLESHSAEIESLNKSIEGYIGTVYQKEMEVHRLEKALKVANEENDRLWRLLNKRQNEVYRDKQGRLRNSNGQFAKKEK